VVLPTVGTETNPVEFDAEEVVAFVRDEANFLNELLLSAKRYNVLNASLATYAERRTKMTDQFPAQMAGNVGTTMLTREQVAMFAPRAAELNMLVTQMREYSRRDFEHLLKLGEKFGIKAQKVLGDPTFPLLRNTNARQI
jgi:hypothetical protein